MPADAEPAEPPAAAPPAQPAGGAAQLPGAEPAGGLGPEVWGMSGGVADERGASMSADVPALALPSRHKKKGTNQDARRERKAGHACALQSGKDNEGLGAGLSLGAGQESWQPDGGAGAPEAAFAPRRGLKHRKKDFLKQRKLKKRGKAVSEAEAGDRLERRLLQDPHRPAFGEQALAPLKVRCCAWQSEVIGTVHRTRQESSLDQPAAAEPTPSGGWRVGACAAQGSPGTVSKVPF